MKQKKTRKENIKSGIFQGLLILSLLFMIVSVSFSWFTSGDHASVSGIQMNVVEPEKMEVLVGGSMSEGGSFNLQFDQSKPLLALSGNGMSFYAPEIRKDANGNLFEDVERLNHVITPDTPASGYADFGAYAIEFTVKSSKATPLCLYGKSGEQQAGIFPAPYDAYKDADRPGDDEIDPGYICGAMRIAILQKNEQGQYETKLIWAPDVTTELTTSNGTSSVKPLGSAETTMTIRGFGENPTNPAKVTASSTLGGVTYVFGKLGDKVVVGDPMRKSEALDESEQSDLSYQGDYRLVIWIDGEDRECSNELMDGLVQIILHLGL